MVLAMSQSTETKMEKEIGSVVWHSVARLPKKNHDAMVRVAKQFNEIFKKHGGLEGFPAYQYPDTYGWHYQYIQYCLSQPR
jgi:hypothetical protein